MSMRAILASCALAVLAGCVTTRIEPPILAHEESGVIIRRVSQFTGGGCTMWVKADGNTVGKVDAGQSIIVRLPNGMHTISMGGCGSDTAAVQRDVELDGKMIHLVFSVHMPGTAFIPIVGFLVQAENRLEIDKDQR